MPETDPNADLIGFRFQAEGYTWEVEGSAGWSDGNYVTIVEVPTAPKFPHIPLKVSTRPAGLVRQARLLSLEKDAATD